MFKKLICFLLMLNLPALAFTQIFTIDNQTGNIFQKVTVADPTVRILPISVGEGKTTINLKETQKFIINLRTKLNDQLTIVKKGEWIWCYPNPNACQFSGYYFVTIK